VKGGLVGNAAALVVSLAATGCEPGRTSSAPDSEARANDSGGSIGALADSGSGFSSLADAGAASAACAHYFAAQYLRCGGPRLPASEMARIEHRFIQVCLNGVALPGSGMTPATVEACASALDVSPCELPDGPPSVCTFQGTFSSGTACNEGFQCQSGGCRRTSPLLSPEGPIGPVSCGTCLPFVDAGDVCAHGDFTGGCAPGQVCLIGAGMQTAAMPTYTCTPVTEGDVSAACDHLSAGCKTGLYCAGQTGPCTALLDAGGPCGTGNPTGCVAPLSCVELPGGATCGLGDAGAFCLNDVDCTPGLGCIPGPCSHTVARIGCAASGTCGGIRWAAPGDVCDGFAVRCLIGSCGSGGFLPGLLPGPDGGPTSGTCPSVTADSRPCGAQCDTFAECFRADPDGGTSGGACVLPDGIVCR
jgi:hypothetical protein